MRSQLHVRSTESIAGPVLCTHLVQRGGGYNDIHRELIDKPNDIATMLGASAEACYTFWHRIAKKPSKPGSLIRAGLVA